MSKKVIDQHNRNVTLLLQCLSAAGFIPVNGSSVENKDTQHRTIWTVWLNGPKQIITQQHRPNEKCKHPRPLFDLYVPLDTTNDMNSTIQSIYTYAKQP